MGIQRFWTPLERPSPILRRIECLPIVLLLACWPLPSCLLRRRANLTCATAATAPRVYVLDAGGKEAERRAVRVGRRNNAQLEVLGGLVQGDRVILSSYAAYGNSPRLQLAR